jgi:hypothetical protein
MSDDTDCTQRVNYWSVRVKLAGTLTLLPISICFIVGGLWINISASKHITPSSVSVSGYYRQDGTYVNAYHRRPPGSLAHDSPYETKETIGEIIAIIGFLGGGCFVYRCFFAPINDILPPVKVGETFIKKVIVPPLNARARKSWVCQKCWTKINYGEVYWYIPIGSGRYSERKRYCDKCHIILVEMNKEEKIKREEQYEKIFGPIRIKEV